MIIPILVATVASLGLGLILSDLLRVPSFAVSKSTHNLGKRQNKKTNPIELWLKEIAGTLVAFVLVFAVNVVSLVALNQNLKTVSDQLTDYATLNGTVAVDSYAAELKKQTGIDFGYSFDGSQLYDANGKVQLGDRIICTVTYQLRMPGFGDFILPISLKASSSGLSQVYWK